MKPTIKSILTLNQLSNPNAILIPSITGEYLDLSTNYGSIDDPNLKFIKSEPWINFQGDAYQPIQDALDDLGYDSIIYIPTSEIQAYFDKLCQKFKETITWSITHHHHIGDDTFYDYLPDLYNMIQYAAYGILITSNDLDADYGTLLNPIIDLIKQFDKAFPEGDRLIDQCSRISLTSFSFLALNSHIINQKPINSINMNTLNCQDLKPEALYLALQICQGFSTVKLALNYNPIANHVTRNHCLVLLEAPAGLTEALIKEGYSLSLESYGLVVSKF